MLTLGIDQSTLHGSLALLDGPEPVATRIWQDSRFRNQHLFQVLPGFLRDASVRPADIGLFAVGLGPGSFSGLRIALAAVQGLALPDAKPVRGIASAAAVAWDVIGERDASKVTIVGDARRGRFWMATFSAGVRGPSLDKAFELVAGEEADERLAAAALLATPDWERIGTQLAARCGARARVIEQNRTPQAATVAQLAFSEHEQGQEPARPLQPIYLHPPVFVKPKFPKKAADDMR